jgi:hypothetical protein
MPTDGMGSHCIRFTDKQGFARVNKAKRRKANKQSKKSRKTNR